MNEASIQVFYPRLSSRASFSDKPFRVRLRPLLVLTLLLLLGSSPADCYSSMSPSSTQQAGSTNVTPLDETSDRLNRWHGRWEELKLGWQMEEVHPIVLKYGDRRRQELVVNESCDASSQSAGGGDDDAKIRWLFPLCGKTVDMAYLAKKETTDEVVGVDGIRRALEEFSKSHPDLNMQWETTTPLSDEESFPVSHERLKGDSVTLLKGDFFALTTEIAGGHFDVVLDRASMVAIDPSLRAQYVATLGRLVRPGGRILLVTVEKRTGDAQAIIKGPPYSINEVDVRRLYESQKWVESVTLLEEIDQFKAKASDDRFQKDGVTSMYELYFLIESKM